jgi:HPt (histidine-containing phosphotransfer) domain-containing protein
MTLINSTASQTNQASLGQLQSYFDRDKGVGMMGSDASLRKIMVSVEASLVSGIPQIQSALLADDVAAANRLLHAIKGYVPIFCSDALVAHVVQVEQLSKTESAAVVAPAFAALAPEFEALLMEIRTYIAQA